ncbi:Uncharacterised protein [Mycobacteroides abscessus subsp. abscessus]|uniref:hypothetical protein n=1 Tax=Mycobacteroides abscessus TaxID=36809 RepID=UPI00092CD0D0|nr:hypothetical protein [Mycobacteroides abscessus]SHU66616.1 Uncharacterised protein [Mycobacteroides abscessus subsp. abscessus]
MNGPNEVVAWELIARSLATRLKRHAICPEHAQFKTGCQCCLDRDAYQSYVSFSDKASTPIPGGGPRVAPSKQILTDYPGLADIVEEIRGSGNARFTSKDCGHVSPVETFTCLKPAKKTPVDAETGEPFTALVRLYPGNEPNDPMIQWMGNPAYIGGAKIGERDPNGLVGPPRVPVDLIEACWKHIRELLRPVAIDVSKSLATNSNSTRDS